MGEYRQKAVGPEQERQQVETLAGGLNSFGDQGNIQEAGKLGMIMNRSQSRCLCPISYNAQHRPQNKELSGLPVTSVEAKNP